jgi:integrase
MAAIHKLTRDKFADAKKKPGRYGDGGGLWLQVRGPSNMSWLFRYKLGGTSHWHGLGDLTTVSITEARKKAEECRKLLADDKDPIEARKEKRAAAAAARAKRVTFKEAAEKYLAAKQSGPKNEKRAQQWKNSLIRYAYPVLGAMSVSAIQTDHVMRVLQGPCVEKDEDGKVVHTIENPWLERNETASRVRGRIESVLSFARVSGWRDGENPARWKGHLDQLLRAPSEVQEETATHFAALPWRQVGSFMEDLADQSGMGALALKFAILCASRSGEVRGARWKEIGKDNETGLEVWTVPAARMKGRREHRVPLSDAALAVLREMSQAGTDPDAFIFPGIKEGKPLSDMSLTAVLKRMKRGDLTAHGFRSTFRDWAGETGQPSDIAEVALAHKLGGKVQLAYQRGDLLERRKHLMAAWAAYCSRPSGGNVVTLDEVKAA